MSTEVFDWIIIGGGIHGVHIAARLLGESKVKGNQLRIIDPGQSLLERWNTSTKTTGMTHLRSPSVHHLDLSPWSLMQYAKKYRKGQRKVFVPPYDRPNLLMFNEHCKGVIDKFQLSNLHIQDRVEQCSITNGGVLIKLKQNKELLARHIVLAIGASEQPAWPSWAPQEHPRVHHIFDPKFSEWSADEGSYIIVGGGISAAQVAIRLVNKGYHVDLVSRHSLRKHQFDSDSGWLGPKLMKKFSREKDFNQRRLLISQARHKGSVPPDVHRALRKAIHDQRLNWHKAEIDGMEFTDNSLQLKLENDIVIKSQYLLLATGFTTTRPGGEMINELIKSASLPCAYCGYPIVDSALRWHPRIHVSGPLAELELGPVSRNIAGARRAADRLVKAHRTVG